MGDMFEVALPDISGNSGNSGNGKLVWVSSPRGSSCYTPVELVKIVDMVEIVEILWVISLRWRSQTQVKIVEMVEIDVELVGWHRC